MFDPIDTETQALRDGLARQPLPAISLDFDARVLAALQKPEPWWAMWKFAAPAALGSMGMMLVVINVGLRLPAAPPSAVAINPRPGPVVQIDLDAMLQNPRFALGGWRGLRLAPPTVPKQPSRKSSVPARTTSSEGWVV